MGFNFHPWDQSRAQQSLNCGAGSKAHLGWLHPGTARGVVPGEFWDVHRDAGMGGTSL